MPPKALNLDDDILPVLQSESMKTSGGMEFESTISSATAKDRTTESKKKDELGHEFHEQRRDSLSSAAAPTKREGAVEESSSGRERLKRHRVEVAGRIWIPDLWGQEDFLKDWIDSTVFDAVTRSTGIMSATAALLEEGRRVNPARFRIENSC